jgi:hypothetical protein
VPTITSPVRSLPLTAPATVTEEPRRTEPTPPDAESGGGGGLDQLVDILTGLGVVFMTFMAAIPGLLPLIALVAGVGILLALPLLAVGLVAGVLAGPPLLVVRLVRRRRGG